MMSIVRTAELRFAIRRPRTRAPPRSFLVNAAGDADESRRLQQTLSLQNSKEGRMSFSLLPLHVSAGIAGILSGTAAISFRKGSPRHALAGKIFVISMLTMAASAVYLAALKHQNNNVGGGVLTFYLVATAWVTAKRRDGETSIFDWAALLIPLWAGIGGWINGLEAVHSPTGSKYGVPAGMHF